MGLRKDLTYEKKETKSPFILTDAHDVDDAIDKAYEAIRDARSFREYAKATGTDVIQYDISVKAAVLLFFAGIATCLLFLWGLGVI